MSQPASLRFELASHEIVELLVGNKIYDTPTWTVVRELLQNAVDACRLRAALYADYTPRIQLEFTPAAAGQPARLQVADNGVGMTEAIARGYFLRVGKSYYSSPDFKARYGEQNFSPIARFGVGVLSCFLVADTVTVSTRHHDSGNVPVCLEIEGLHSTIASRDPGDIPIGTELVLGLQAGVTYHNLADVVRHWARHVEIPITVITAGRQEVVPPDDGAGFEQELLDPAHYVVLNPLRFPVLKTRRIQFHDDELTGFFEYPYLEAQGRIRRFDSREGRGIIEVYDDRLPQSVSLDGIFVGRQLPTALPGFRVAYTAFDLNVNSRLSGVSLRLDRGQFVDDLAFRRLLARLDQALLADLVDLVRAQDLTPVQFADTLSDLLQVRQITRQGSETARAIWDAVAALPVFPLRLDGKRQYVDWSEFSRLPRLARLKVGSERVVWPGSTEDLAEDFWWARQHMFCQSMDAALPFLTSYDTTELVESFLEQACQPVAVVIDPWLCTSYMLYEPTPGRPDTFANLPVLPVVTPKGEPASPQLLCTYVDGWVLNASNPYIAGLRDLDPRHPGRTAGVKALRDLRARLRTLPPGADAREALDQAAAALRAATGVDAGEARVPVHDCSEHWDAEWLRFVRDGMGN